jgi:predicted secreted protein
MAGAVDQGVCLVTHGGHEAERGCKGDPQQERPGIDIQLLKPDRASSVVRIPVDIRRTTIISATTSKEIISDANRTKAVRTRVKTMMISIDISQRPVGVNGL